jgi:LSM domain
MNIALEKTEEYVNGELKRSYGDAFVRGNNGTSKRIASIFAGRLVLTSE